MNTHRTLVIAIAVLSILVFPLALKISHVEWFIHYYTGSRFLGSVQVLVNDSIIYFYIICCLYVSLRPDVNRSISIILRIISLGLIILYTADCLVIKNFNTHLTVNDVFKYFPYAAKYILQIYQNYLILIIIISLSLLFLAVNLVLTTYQILDKKIHYFSYVAIFTLGAIYSVPDNVPYVHSWIYRNFIDYNMRIASESVCYTDKFKEKLVLNKGGDCVYEKTAKQNIIVIMMESLSCYQSKIFSGINNWTPNLDAIASDNIFFTNFFANGFNTEDAEISLLTGLLPLYPPATPTDRGCASFHGFFDIADSLPAIFKKNGYHTEFITAADLSFSDTGHWVQRLGVDYIES